MTTIITIFFVGATILMTYELIRIIVSIVNKCNNRKSLVEMKYTVKPPSFTPTVTTPPSRKKKYVNFSYWSGVEFYIIKYVKKRCEEYSFILRNGKLKELQKEVEETGSTVFFFADDNKNTHTIQAFRHWDNNGNHTYTVRAIKKGTNRSFADGGIVSAKINSKDVRI